MADRFGSDQVERALAMQEGSVLANEVLRLRAIEQRAAEAHAKAVDAVQQLESWRAVEDVHARTVLNAKWGSAMFYRDKLAHILGET